MRLLESFTRSIHDLSWLKTHRTAVKWAWGYFFALLLVASVATEVPLAVVLPSSLRELKDSFVKQLPEFTATLKNKELTVSGLPVPYVVHDQDKNNMLAVNTVATGTVELSSFLANPHENGVLVTRHKIELSAADRGRTQSQSFDALPDYTFTKSMIVNGMNQLLSPLMLALILLVLFVVFFIALVISKLVITFIVTAIVFGVSRFARPNWKFSELFTVGLFAATLPLLISLLFTFAGIDLGLVYFLALFAFMLAVVLTKDKVSDPQIL